MMISKISMNFIFAFLLPVTLMAQPPKGYVIHGHIKGLEEGEKIIMRLSNSRGFGNYEKQLINKDSAFVTNGQFIISGFVPNGPRQYEMEFSKHYKVINRLFIDNNEEITISSADIDKIPHQYIRHYVTIDGSPYNYSIFCLEPGTGIYYQSISRIKNYARHLQDSIGFDGKLLDAVFASREILNTAFYQEFFAGEGQMRPRDPEIIRSNLGLPTTFGDFEQSGHASFWFDVYNNLEEQRKMSFYGKCLRDEVTLCIGQPFPEFTLPQVDGKPLPITQIISKSKITLVHFGRFNANTMEEYDDELQPMYKKFHDKGLNIVGISADDNQEQWKETLKTKQYPWYNVIDLKGKLSESIYQEPADDETSTNVLLDDTGKIIAWGVNGAELQWYLWKELQDKIGGKEMTK